MRIKADIKDLINKTSLIDFLVFLLLLLFIAFKLAGILTWNWWWIFCPAWIPASLWFLNEFLKEFNRNDDKK